MKELRKACTQPSRRKEYGRRIGNLAKQIQRAEKSIAKLEGMEVVPVSDIDIACNPCFRQLLNGKKRMEQALENLPALKMECYEN